MYNGVLFSLPKEGNSGNQIEIEIKGKKIRS